MNHLRSLFNCHQKSCMQPGRPQTVCLWPARCLPSPALLSNMLETSRPVVDRDRHNRPYNATTTKTAKRRWHTDNTNNVTLEWYKIQQPDLLNPTSPHHPTTTSLQTTTTFASHNPFTTFSQSTQSTKWPSSSLSSSPPWLLSLLLPPPAALPITTPTLTSTPSRTPLLAVTARSLPAATAVRTSSVPTA
jgi:hypothetical protein